MNTLPLLFDWALAASLRATFLVVVVLALQTVFRHHLSPRWRYALWLPVLMVLLMPVFPQSAWSLESLLARSTPSALAPVITQESEQTSPALEREALADAPSGPASASPSLARDWRQIGTGVWLAGTTILFASGLIAYGRTLRRVRRQASAPDESLLMEIRQLAAEVKLSRLPEVIVSTQVQSPAVTGLWRSVLMLPAGFADRLEAEETRLVLKHELMHLKRGDLPINFLLCALLTLHWFNPLLWFAFFKARTDREAACDEQVLHEESPARRHAYGCALLKVESAFTSQGFCLGFVGIFQRGAALRSRIQAIASARTAAPQTRVILVTAMMAMIFLGATRAQSPATAGDRSGPGFVVGASKFKPGDEIRIFKVDRDADRMIVTGAYELGSEDSATLGLYISSIGANPPKAVFDSRQHATVQRGHGSFTLTFPRPHTGLPHVTFYKPAQRGAPSSAFGGIYFGTAEEAEASRKIDLSYMTADAAKTARPATVANMYLTQKMERIILPQVQFSGATLEEAVEFLRAKARTLDTLESDPKRRGVNILLRKDAGTGAQISLDLKDVPLMEALRYTTELAGVKFRVEPYAVLIEPASEPKIVRAPASTSSPAPKLTGKAAEVAQKIVLPQVQFRDATLEEALEFIRTKNRHAEDGSLGIPNIILKPGAASTAQITLDLKDVPLIEALRYIAELSNHTLRSDDHAFILEPR